MSLLQTTQLAKSFGDTHAVDRVDFSVHEGEVLCIPSNVPHAVEAMEDSVVVDVFAPSRDDWARGDDAYLRK